MNRYRLARKLESRMPLQNDNAGAPNEVNDFGKLHRILSKSRSSDIYCRSALYFAFTGRGTVWTIKHGDSYLILVPHPNAVGILLVFFPFVEDLLELTDQVRALSKYKPFLEKFQEVLLARIPESVTAEIPQKAVGHNSIDYKLEIVSETKLDWAFPSYDVGLQGLVNPDGGKLKTYRKKVRKFCDQGIEIIRPRDLDRQEWRNAVSQVNMNWIQTKLRKGNLLQNSGVTLHDLKDPYEALAQLCGNVTLDVDGLILKRKGAYVAFSLWEHPSKGDIVPCMAALPSSHERGLSEYLYYCIAQRLLKYGYDEMCIGGSETVGLDHFKQKLGPTGVHRLGTIKLAPRDQTPF